MRAFMAIPYSKGVCVTGRCRLGLVFRRPMGVISPVGLRSYDPKAGRMWKMSADFGGDRGLPRAGLDFQGSRLNSLE
jgi:hypothetical protein